MAKTAVATLQTIWDCRWSRPRYRLFGTEGHMQPEKLWVCIREGERRSVTEEECEHCVYWQALPDHDAN